MSNPNQNSNKPKHTPGFGLHVLENPNGTFSFVGTVPVELGYVTKAGNRVTPEEVESQHRLPASYRTIKCRVFSTADEAWFEAARLGYVQATGGVE